MRISREGIRHIQDFEGFRPRVYLDIAGKKTIGYGHLVRPGEHFTVLSQAQATELMMKDLAEVERCINHLVTVELTQHQFDALGSFVFNFGCTDFQTSTLLRLLNAGDYVHASKEFLRWDHVRINGHLVEDKRLLDRRVAERAMFNTPDDEDVA